MTSWSGWGDGVMGEFGKPNLQYSNTPSLHWVEMFAMATANNDAPLAAELKLIAGLTVKIAEPLARYTSMKIGGPADYFIEVENDAALANLLGVLSRHQEIFCLLGNGSNVLISDRGVRGAVIHLAGEFKQAQWREEDETVATECGRRLRGGATGTRKRRAKATPVWNLPKGFPAVSVVLCS